MTDRSDRNVVLSASPNPIPLSEAGAAGVTTLTWRGGTTVVDVRVGSPSGPLLSTGGADGETATGPWVTDGMTFYLCEASGESRPVEGRALASVTVRLRQPARASAVILMYHRVARVEIDPWGLAVTPERFDEQLASLRPAGFQPVALSELCARLAAGTPVDRLAAVTFDDGYADNLTAARPVLERHRIPATMFVTSGHVASGQEFWWDTLDRLLTAPALPAAVCWHAQDGLREVRLSPEEQRAPLEPTWRVAHGTGSGRQRLYALAYQDVRSARPSTRQATLRAILDSAGLHDGRRESYRPLTPGELVQLSRGELIEIGAHSVSHPDLPPLSLDEQSAELTASKAALERIVGRPVRAFSYPFGAASPLTVELVKASGFTSACTTDPGVVESESELLLLPRLMVLNWTGGELRHELSLAAPGPVTD